MHCRRVRSYLSAFSNDELTGAVLREVREHLATCRECRSEEAIYRSVRLATHQMPNRHLSADFNAKILNRVANERFAETRAKAYLPKAAPTFVWRRLVPVLSSVAVIALVAIGVAQYTPSPNKTNGGTASVDIGKNDDYLTVQPMSRDWRLDNHLAQSDRITNLTTSMTQPFDPSASLAGNRSGNSGVWVRGPRMQGGYIYLYRVRPVIRMDNPTATNASYKESDRVY